MTFYHGSPIGGLNKLEPFLSEHGRHYIYFATNPLVALLYAVKPVPKPNRSAPAEPLHAKSYRCRRFQTDFCKYGKASAQSKG